MILDQAWTKLFYIPSSSAIAFFLAYDHLRNGIAQR